MALTTGTVTFVSVVKESVPATLNAPHFMLLLFSELTVIVPHMIETLLLLTKAGAWSLQVMVTGILLLFIFGLKVGSQASSARRSFLPTLIMSLSLPVYSMAGMSPEAVKFAPFM